MEEESKDDFEESGISDNDDYLYRRDTARHWGVLHPLVLALISVLFFLVCLLQTTGGQRRQAAEFTSYCRGTAEHLDGNRYLVDHMTNWRICILIRHNQAEHLRILSKTSTSRMPFWRNLTMNLKPVLETEVESSVFSRSSRDKGWLGLRHSLLTVHSC